MISVNEAEKIIRDNRPEVRRGSVKLEQAAGRVLAGDILAPQPSPSYTNSAMDGFAVRWSDIQKLPAELPISGESRAGVPLDQPAAPQTAVRISTGAMLPPELDTVIPIEDCEVNADRVRILQAKKAHQHVRFRGEEFQQGDVLLKAGAILNPPQLALLASVGVAEVPVILPPRVAIIVTGSELVKYDQPAAPHQVRDSNSLMLATAVVQAGGEVVLREMVADDPESTVAVLQRAAQKADIVLFSGGVSVGPHDHVKTAAEQAGFQPRFWKIRQKPGKPFFFATKEDCLFFGLPGNPVSAFMGFVYYIDPLIRDLAGHGFHRLVRPIPAAQDFDNPGKRTQFLRVQLFRESSGAEKFTILPRQGSHMISSIAGADGYIILPEGGHIKNSEKVNVYLFPWRRTDGIY